MPTRVWPYLTAWLYDRPSASCVALAAALPSGSHDRLRRLWQADWSGQRLLALTCRPVFAWRGGDLLIDDPVMAQPCATAIESLAWVSSSRDHRPVYGLSLVLLVWTNGTVRFPRGRRLWHKGRPSESDWALAWLSYARTRLRCHPEYVLCEAWYPSTRLLNRIRD